jgi:hypothetical protein
MIDLKFSLHIACKGQSEMTASATCMGRRQDKGIHEERQMSVALGDTMIVIRPNDNHDIRN